MRIVLPVHHFPPRYSAGAELYTYRLAHWLLNHGHEVEVVCVEAIDQGSVGELTAVHDQYEGIPVWRLSYNIFDAPERRRWDFDNPLIGAWFASYLEENRPDIIHFQAAYLLSAAPFRAAHAAKIPTVLTLHDYWLLCPRITLRRGDNSLCETIPENPAGCAWCHCTEQRRYQIADQVTSGLAGILAQQTFLREQASLVAERRKTLGAVLAHVDHVIAPSTFLARRYAAQVSPERMTTLRYGLDLARFAQLPPKRNQGPLRIGFTGQMAPHKGVHLLIEAFRLLRSNSRPLELHLYGGLEALPAYVATLRAKAGSDQRITFHGRFEHQQAPDILAGLDVAVVPSTWYENSPLAIMEAHAAGTPVVTARLGGMAELVQDEVDGLHFAPNQAHDLARALQRLVDEPELLGKLQAGITLPPSIDHESSTLLALYEQICAESQLSPVPYT